MRPIRSLWYWLLPGLLAVLGGGVFALHGAVERHYLAELEAKGQASAELYREVVRGWLGRYRALAPIHARNPDIVRLLRWPEDGVQIDLVNAWLEEWTSATGASDTYVLDADGRTLAASNWSEPHSFVGRNYGFRPYFSQAMEGRLGRYFALGTRSGKRGYYFAFPVRDAGQVRGAVVVKVPVDAIEQELRASPAEVFLTDDAGVVLLAGHPAWRLKTLGPIAPAGIAEIRASRQFDAEALDPVPIEGAIAGEAAGSGLVWALPDRSEAVRTEFLHVSVPMVLEGWRLHLMLATAPARAQIATALMLAGALTLLLLSGAVILLQHRRRLVERLAARARAEAALEQAVADRTADLRRTQAELVQAGKLAALGQMSAALSHEFNQPLAAVRSYAENAAAFLDRGQGGRAVENLSRIARLTERMADLSKHLTRFARKPKDTLGPVPLSPVLEETLALLAGRLERADVALEIAVPEDLVVLGGHTRLSHVLMNLIGNAIDASAAQAEPWIRVSARAHGERVEIEVRDNGPGVAPEVAETLFDPFVTTKPEGQGLGLGLSITYNILSDFGGGITVRNAPGACFTVWLHPAILRAEAAE
ncbi:MAG: ATP-binding protein [Pseudomonadota bacterium]